MPEPKKNSFSHPLLWIFLLALLLRAGFAFTRPDALAWPDSQDYDSYARNLLAGNGFTSYEGKRASRAPGYPLFLAALYRIGLDSPRAVQTVQAIIGAATCVLIALLGKRVFDRKTGLIAGTVAAVYPFFIYYSAFVLSETLFMLGLVATFAGLDAMRRAAARTWRRLLAVSVAAGLLLGATLLIRSSLLLYPLLLLPIWLIAVAPRSRAAAGWGVMVLTASVVLTPWVVRNYRVFDRFVPTTLQVGASLYEANAPEADGGPGMEHVLTARPAGKAMSEVEHNAHFRREAVAYMRTHPGRTASLAIEKFRRFWNPLPNERAFRRPLYAAVSLLCTLPIMLAALLGFVLHRARADLLVLLLSPVLYFTLLHMIFVGSTRYRTPVMPFVIIAAAAGAAAWWERTRESRASRKAAGHA